MLSGPGLAPVCVQQRPSCCQPFHSHSLHATSVARRRHASHVQHFTKEDAKDRAPASAGSTAEVHDGRVPYLQSLRQFTKPLSYSLEVLAGHKYAWGRMGLVPGDALFIADPVAVRSMLSSEWQNGIRSDWPPTFRALLGDSSIAMVKDAELHGKLRHIMGPYFSAEAIQQLMPAIHSTVAKHMARWAAAGTVSAYAAAKALTFDVLANQALGLNMTDGEVEKYAQVFKQWTDGFMPPAINLPFFPFGRGMAARHILLERVQQSLSDPNLPPDGLLARFRDEFGEKSDIAKDNTINLMFAGHDTTSSAITWLLYQLALNPHVVDKLRQEHAAVQAQHGEQLTPAAVAALQYTAAAAKETLRTAQIIGYVPRKADRAFQVPHGGPKIPSGCPFIIAFGAMSFADPAMLSEAQSSWSPDTPDSSLADLLAFQPDRWLQPQLAKSTQQMPFGMGQHYCLGSHLAMAELTAVLTVLARSYSLAAATNTEWKDFPIKRPDNGLPCSLTPLAAAAAAV